ncbi:MAG: molybdopterin-dependent oxidoreductase [Lachnospiraceae bacterium]
MSEIVTVKTTCGICGSCCKMDASIKDGELVYVEGSQSPSDNGRLCVKGLATKQFVYNKERVRYPMKRIGKKGEGKFERISWDEAYCIIADKLLAIRREHGAKSTVFYTGYPKWLRPALLRFSNAYGSPNYCTESSTCFQAAALAWRSIYGNHICGPDLMHSKTVLIWSSNLYHSNSPMSDMYQQLKKRGVKTIVIDPRNTVTAHEAWLHLRPAHGTDGALALSMAQVILAEHLQSQSFIDQYVYGFEEYQAYVKQFTPEWAEIITTVPAEHIRLAARTFATHTPSSILFSAASIVHHVNGVQNYRAVFSLSAITGNYDTVGGNCPQAGMSSPCNEFGKVKRLNNEEAIGEKDFPVWFDLSCEEAQCTKLADYILDEQPYPIKAIFAMGLNHRMWPQPEHLQQALKKLDFYVNVELFMSDSSLAADLVLPACTSFEREEIHMLKGGKFLFSNRAIEPVGESKNDIEIIMALMKRMNLKDEVLSNGYDAYMAHIIEPSGLSLEELKKSPEGLSSKHLISPSYGNYKHHHFQTPSGKIELKSITLETYHDSHGYDGLPVYHDFRNETTVNRKKFPLILSTGCRKPQFFHSKVYRVPWLSNLEAAPLVEIHPEDGKTFGIHNGQLIKIISPVGEVSGIASYDISGRPGVVYMCHGNADGDVNELIDKDYLDPISGFPGYKSYFCTIEKGEVK